MDSDLFKATNQIKEKLEKLQLRMNSSQSDSRVSSEDLRDVQKPSSKPTTPLKIGNIALLERLSNKKQDPKPLSNLPTPALDLSKLRKLKNDSGTPKIEFGGFTSPRLKSQLLQPSNSVFKKSLNEIKPEPEKDLVKSENSDIEKRKKYLDALNDRLIQEISSNSLEFENIILTSNEKVKHLENEMLMNKGLIERLEKENANSKKIRDDYLKIIQNQKLEITKLKKVSQMPDLEAISDTKNSMKLKSIKFKMQGYAKNFFLLKKCCSQLRDSHQEMLSINSLYEKGLKKVLYEANFQINSLNKGKKNVELELSEKNEKISTLEAQISDFYKEKFEFQRSSLNFNYKIVILNEKIKEHEKEMNEAKNNFQSQLQKEKIEYDKNLEKLGNTINNFKNELDKARKEKNVLNLKLDEACNEINKLNQEISDINTENLGLMQNSITTIEEKLGLENKINQVSSKYKNTKQEKKIEEEKRKKIEKDLENEKNKLQDSEKKNQEASKIIESLEENLRISQENLELLHLKSSEVLGKIKEFETEKEELKKILKIYEKDLSEKGEANENLMCNTQGLFERIESIKEKKRHYKKEWLSFQNNKNFLETTNKKYEDDIKNLKIVAFEQYEKMKYENDKLKEEINQKDLEITQILKAKAQIQSELDYFIKKLEDFKSELTEMETRKLELVKEIEEKNRQNEKLIVINENLTEKTKKLQGNLKSIEFSFVDNLNEKEKFKKELNALQQKINSCEKTIEEKNFLIQNYEIEIEVLKGNQITEDINELIEKLQIENSEFSKQLSESIEKIEDLNKDVESLGFFNSQLTKNIEEKVLENSEVSKKLSDCLEKIEDLNKKTENLESLNAQLTKNIENNSEHSEKLLKSLEKIEDLNKNIENLTTLNAQLTFTIEEKGNMLQIYEENIIKYENAIELLNKNIAELENYLYSKESSIKELENLLESATNTQNNLQISVQTQNLELQEKNEKILADSQLLKEYEVILLEKEKIISELENLNNSYSEKLEKIEKEHLLIMKTPSFSEEVFEKTLEPLQIIIQYKSIEDLEKIYSKNEEIAILQKELQQNAVFIEELENIIKEIRSENDKNIEEMVKNFNSVEEVLTKEILELNNEINRLQQENSILLNQNDELKLSIIVFNESKEQIHTKELTADIELIKSSDLNVKSQIISQLEIENSALKANNQQLQNNLIECTENFEKKKKLYQQIIDENEEKIKILENALKIMNKKLSEIEENYRETIRRIKIFSESETQELKSRIFSLEHKNQELMLENEKNIRTKIELVKARERIKAIITGQGNENNVKINEVLAKNDQYFKELQLKIEEKNKVLEDYKKLEEKYDEIFNEKQKLEVEVDSLKDELIEIQFQGKN